MLYATNSSIFEHLLHMKPLYSLLLASVLLVACDDKPLLTDDIVLPPPVKGSVMVVNEGNFNSGNAGVTYLDLANDKLYEDLFQSANARKLGDVFQSVNLLNGKAYLVVNNSQKIEVTDPASLKSIATITGFVSPRYILQVDGSRAYVSEFYAGRISMVDLSTHTITGFIPITGMPEEMVLLNKKVYVTNVKSSYVYVINTETHTLEDSIAVVPSSNSIQVDANKNIWVLSNGDANKGIRPALQRINTLVDTVDRTFSLIFAEADCTRLRINGTRNTLFWLSKHVYRFAINESQPSSAPWIRSFGQNFYGLGVNPFNNEVYVSDAKDFVQRSEVYRYRSDASPVGSFKAGIITGGFYFYYP